MTGKRTQNGATWYHAYTLNNSSGFAEGAPVSTNHKGVREGRKDEASWGGVGRIGICATLTARRSTITALLPPGCHTIRRFTDRRTLITALLKSCQHATCQSSQSDEPIAADELINCPCFFKDILRTGCVDKTSRTLGRISCFILSATSKVIDSRVMRCARFATAATLRSVFVLDGVFGSHSL